MGTTKMDNQTIKAPLYIHQADMKKVIYNQCDNVEDMIVEDSKAYFKLICEGRLVLNRHEEVMREIDALGQ